MSADRNLLFGILALQLDFITREQLIAGMQAWVNDKTKPLAQILEAAGALDAANRQLLEPLVAKHIQQHANDPQQSLAAVRAASLVKHDLQAIRDDELHATLSTVSAAKAKETDDLFATVSLDPARGSSLSAAQATSNGKRYRFLREYRQGGLGVVNIAQDTELDREVALKEMKPKYAYDPSGRLRFVREAEITGGLEHPNIVPVYGLGAHADGRPFYAMRLIRGDTSLADEIKAFHAASKNPYAADQNLRLRNLLQRFIAVCDAIEYAHSRGVIHRDLKPANIMLGKFGETLVVDWGLAKLLQREGDPDQTLDGGQEPVIKTRSKDSAVETSMGSAIGTPQYMAPEQAEGRLDLLGPATDVYGLGATLYALLTGQAPVDGKSSEEVLTHVRKGETVPARTRLYTIPAPLAAICAKALSYERTERYPSAKDLAADISAYLADEPVSAYREPITVRARRWTRKHPALVSSGFASALVTMLGLLVGFVVLGQKNRELAEKEAIATAVKDFLIYDLLQLAAAENQAAAKIEIDPELKVHALLDRGRGLLAAGYLHEQPRAQAEIKTFIESGLRAVDPELTVKETVTRARTKIQSSFLQHPLIEAEVRSALGYTLCQIGEFNLGVLEFTRAKDLYSALLGAEHPHTIRSMHNLAAGYSSAGRLDEALPLTLETLRLKRARLGPEHPDTLESLGNVAVAYDGAGRLGEAVPLYEETHRLMTATLGTDHLNTLRSMLHLANAYRRAGRMAEALPLYEKSLRQMKSTLGPEHPDSLNSLAGLAAAYRDVGRVAEALPLYEEAFRLRKAKLGPEHPGTLDSMAGLAAAYRDLGRAAEALPLYEEAFRLHKAKLGADHPDTLQSMDGLAFTYQHVGRVAETLPLYEEAFRIRKAKLGPEHPGTLDSMSGLASAYHAVGRVAEALPISEETFRLRKEKLGPDHPDTLDSMTGLAVAYQEIGRLAEALPLYEECLQLRKTKLGPEHPHTLYSMHVLAAGYLSMGRVDEALPLLEETLQLRKAKLGPEHPDTLGSMTNLALIYRTVGRLDRALPLAKESFSLSKAKLGPEHPDTLAAMNNVALTYLALGRFDDALPIAEEKLRLSKVQFGPDHPHTLGSITNLATVYGAVGRLTESIALYEEALRLRKAKLGSEHPDTLSSIYNLAYAYQAAGRLEKALPLYEEVIPLLEAQIGPEHPHTLRSKSQLSWLLATARDVNLRNPPRAVELAQAAVAAAPSAADYRGVLGIARYRTGDWKNAIADLQAAAALRQGVFSVAEGFFLAMAHWQLGETDDAREWLAKAVKRMEARNPKDPELKRFRAEAEELIGE